MKSELKAELLDLAISIAKQAGELLMARPDVFDLEMKSSAIDFATQMDIASEKLIVSKILEARPDDGIIGEEGASIPSKSGVTWVIDPLDGTVNYFYGIAGWNVSIAAKDSEGVQVGVVNAPSINSFWSATKDGGATCNGKKIKCNDPVEFNRALIATGFSYDVADREAQAALVSKLLLEIRDLRRIGAGAADLCLVATGRLDGFYERGLNEWDLAAGGLIATEAGALVTGRNGGPAGKEMVIAAGAHLHARLVAEIG
ncbi:MAG: inositol monophosphatase [Actinobacteria bacterium]|nr:inositol monophosphatase [Actinomycetota bacterium]